MRSKYIEKLVNELASVNENLKSYEAERLPLSSRQWHETEQHQLALERKIAELRGDEYATEFQFEEILGYNWFAIGGFGQDAKLICDLMNKSGSIVITFPQTMAMKFGGLNDEVFEGHPLYGNGLAINGCFIVNNSKWLNQLCSGMKLHRAFNHSLWEKMKHFLFRDKDGEFECLATGYSVTYNEESVERLRDKILEF
jgi:hypothetical protein